MSTAISAEAGLYLSALLSRFSTTSSREVRSASTISWPVSARTVISRSGCRRLNAATDGLHHVGEQLGLQVHLGRGAEPGQHQQVLDDAEQPFRVLGDVRDHGAPIVLGDLVAAVTQEPGVAEDRGDWRPQLVRDEAEELVLDRVRDAQRIGSGAQLPFDADLFR